MKKLFVILGIFIIASLNTQMVLGQSSSSPSYRIDESNFSVGGDIDSNSASYNARTGVGNIGVGESASSTLGAFAGPITPKEEYLEVYVNNVNVNLGLLTPSTTGTGTSTFYVRAYINSNYNILAVSDTLTSEGNATIDGMVVAAVPSVGTEQFGINLVDNTSPNIGANPVPQPDSSFANGEAAPGYDTIDNFKYVADEAIARSDTSGRAWGRTDYTISYIANVSNITPAGSYSMRQDLVAVATF